MKARMERHLHLAQVQVSRNDEVISRWCFGGRFSYSTNLSNDIATTSGN